MSKQTEKPIGGAILGSLFFLNWDIIDIEHFYKFKVYSMLIRYIYIPQYD